MLSAWALPLDAYWAPPMEPTGRLGIEEFNVKFSSAPPVLNF